jgi:hypothetical protein
MVDFTVFIAIASAGRVADAFHGKRIQRLHFEPGIFVARAVEHIGAEWQIVAVAVKLGISLQGNISQV